MFANIKLCNTCSLNEKWKNDRYLQVSFSIYIFSVRVKFCNNVRKVNYYNKQLKKFAFL